MDRRHAIIQRGTSRGGGNDWLKGEREHHRRGPETRKDGDEKVITIA